MSGPTSSDSIDVYDAHAERLAAEYEAADPGLVWAGISDLLPKGPDRLALDVGAGSGRDAAWLAQLGFDVVALEPAQSMRSLARKLHPEASIRWRDDRLPALSATHSLGLSFDLILMSAVWHHVAPAERQRAFRKIANLLKPGGLLVMTLRDGPVPPARPMHAVSASEIEALAREHGLAVSRVSREPDRMGRADIDWTTICLTLPDDGAGALPLLRGVILNDDKSATYKLGLLRAIAKVADLAPNLGRSRVDADLVDVPLGAIALNWVRMYLPLVAQGLPQMPRNSGPDGLGFAKSGFRAVLVSGLAGQDLRIGAAFAGDRALAVSRAIAEAARTITTMPANFIRYPNSDARMFPAMATRAPRPQQLVLDENVLASFGSVSVPGHVWRAMQRLCAWIEPLLIVEWARLTRAYAERQGMSLLPGQVEAALAWTEPMRTVRIARNVALAQMAKGDRLTCVWTGRRLDPATLDIDHCLPWTAWPCGDLWNLLPAHRLTNQREKRDRLPSASALASAGPAIVEWWDEAWRQNAGLNARFEREASAALPIGDYRSNDAVFDALEWRRLRLRQDHQLSEWPAENVG